MSWVVKVLICSVLGWLAITLLYLVLVGKPAEAAPNMHKEKTTYPRLAKAFKPTKPPIKPLTLKKSLAVREYKSKPV